MALLPVLAFPDPRLKIASKLVERVDDAIRTLMKDMHETMLANDGCGLAAPQVNIHKRIVVMDFTYKDPNFDLFHLINPEILEASKELFDPLEEGCLSVPEYRGFVRRPRKIRFRYTDQYNVTHEREAEDLLAVCIHHEIDHLNGKLFIDRLSPLRRQLILSKLKKLKR